MHEKKKDKVAIVGMAPSTRDDAPFGDKDFEIWGCNEMYQYVPRLDVLFEIHDKWEYQAKKRNKNHLKWLQDNKTIPVYMSVQIEDIPMSIAYPWDEVIAKYGTYITSTTVIQLLLAYLMKYKEIHIYGIEMNAQIENYGVQKSALEHYIGYGYGMYHSVGKPLMYLPPECSLLKTPIVYGKEGVDRWAYIINNAKKEYQKMYFSSEQEMLRYRDAYNYAKGGKEAMEKIQRMDYKK